MNVTCHYPGGISFCGLKLRHGPNEVEASDWESAKSAVNHDWLCALLFDEDGRTPYLDAGPEAAPVMETMTAKDKVAIVSECETVEELEIMQRGEDRKTVLDAIDRKLAALAEAEG